jgi:peptidyl-prolyl cis-trans isomerase C
MKSNRHLVVALSASFIAANSLLGADAPAKAKAKPAPAPEPPPAAEAAPAPKASELPAVVAVVDGVEIKGPELEQTFNGFLASRQIPADALPPAEKARGYRMILEEMIKEKLIEKRAADTKVTDEEVTDTFKKFTANIGSEEEVKKQIEASGQTIEKLRENIRTSLKQDHWLEAEVAKTGGVTDKDAQDFYDKNGDKFVSPAQVRASHILVKVDADAKPETVAEKEKAAKGIAARAKKGEDFGKMAKELSEDPSAKENSGDLDFFGKEQMVPEFSDAAFAMKKGDISEPVRSSFGFHVIKLTDRKDSETVPLDKVKPRVVAFLKAQKAEALKQEIRQKAEVKINLPEPPPAPAVPPGAAPAPAPAAPAAK